MCAWDLQLGLGFVDAFEVFGMFAMCACGFGVCRCMGGLQIICNECSGFAAGFGFLQLHLGSAGCLRGLQLGLGFAAAWEGCRVFAVHAQGLQMGLGFAGAFWGLQGVCRVCSWVWGLQVQLEPVERLQPELRVCSRVWGLQLHLGSAECLQGVLRACTEFASGFGVCSCIWGLQMFAT